MDTTNTTSSNFMKLLRENWFIIIFIGGLVMGWSSFQSRVDYLETRVGKLESIAEAQQKQSQELSGAIIEIKANYIFIKASLEKIK